MELAGPISVTLRLTEILEELGIRHLVGGSLASSLHGIPRATQDVDLVADLRPGQVEAFLEKVGDEFYVDRDMVRDAVRRRSCFNLIHLDSMFKLDVFVLSDDPAQAREMERRRSFIVDPDSNRSLVVASAEDIILMKLQWYRAGGEVSDRQWSDALGVIKVQGAGLDTAYLHRGATQMEIGDLLAKALEQASLEEQ